MWPVCMADNLTTFMCRLSWNLEVSNSWNPQGLSRPVMGLLFFIFIGPLAPFIGLYIKYRLFLPILMILEFYQQIFEKCSIIKFYANPSMGEPSCYMRTDGRTDRRTDMTKLIVVFRNFGNSPKKTRQQEILENTNTIQIRFSGDNIYITTQ
jgi:hypothetical protein